MSPSVAGQAVTVSSAAAFFFEEQFKVTSRKTLMFALRPSRSLELDYTHYHVLGSQQGPAGLARGHEINNSCRVTADQQKHERKWK